MKLHELELNEGPVSGVRSGAARTQSGRELFASFEGGEIACLIEEGSLLGSWLLRGTVWLTDPALGPMSLDWIAGDHVLSSIEVASGEPFRIEDVAARGWHLELRLGDGRSFALRPAISGAADARP